MTTFVNADAVIGSSRTVVYTAPAGITAVVFSGTISNVDPSMVDRKVTLERRKSDGTTYFARFKDLPIGYGGAQNLPKIILTEGESLVATCDAASMAHITLDIAEGV